MSSGTFNLHSWEGYCRPLYEYNPAYSSNIGLYHSVLPAGKNYFIRILYLQQIESSVLIRVYLEVGSSMAEALQYCKAVDSSLNSIFSLVTALEAHLAPHTGQQPAR